MDLEAFPNTTLKMNAKTKAKKSEKCEFGPATWALGMERSMPFGYIFRPWGTLGSQNGLKTPPKSLRDPSGPQF